MIKGFGEVSKFFFRLLLVLVFDVVKLYGGILLWVGVFYVLVCWFVFIICNLVLWVCNWSCCNILSSWLCIGWCCERWWFLWFCWLVVMVLCIGVVFVFWIICNILMVWFCRVVLILVCKVMVRNCSNLIGLVIVCVMFMKWNCCMNLWKLVSWFLVFVGVFSWLMLCLVVCCIRILLCNMISWLFIFMRIMISMFMLLNGMLLVGWLNFIWSRLLVVLFWFIIRWLRCLVRGCGLKFVVLMMGWLRWFVLKDGFICWVFNGIWNFICWVVWFCLIVCWFLMNFLMLYVGNVGRCFVGCKDWVGWLVKVVSWWICGELLICCYFCNLLLGVSMIRVGLIVYGKIGWDVLVSCLKMVIFLVGLVC